MNFPTPTQVKQVSSSELSIVWSDTHTSPFSMKRLRDECPCAGCNGETILLKSYRPPDPDLEVPGRYELKGIEQVGGYALKFVWADGHDTGLYTWEYLRGLCKCTECSLDRKQK